MTDEQKTNEATLRDFLKYSVRLSFSRYALLPYLSNVDVEYAPIEDDSNFQFADVTANVLANKMANDLMEQKSISGKEADEFVEQIIMKLMNEVCDLFKDIMRQNGPCAIFHVNMV